MATNLLYLVRHGEADHDSDDPGLTASGRSQADRLGARLSGIPFEAIEHSPLLRAEQTAMLVGLRLPGVPVRASEFLRDLTPVAEPGREAEYTAREREWLADVPEVERDPGGRQITAALTHFARRTESPGSPGERHHLLITHAFVVGRMVCQVLDTAERTWLSLQALPVGLTVIRCPEQGPLRLVSFNDTGHLVGAAPN